MESPRPRPFGARGPRREKFDNRSTWDNRRKFDSRPGWDNWNKKK
ncbi:multiple cyclophane-containing RiPP AmcA [Micromonospora narathiwatensis]